MEDVTLKYPNLERYLQNCGPQVRLSIWFAADGSGCVLDLIKVHKSLDKRTDSILIQIRGNTIEEVLQEFDNSTRFAMKPYERRNTNDHRFQRLAGTYQSSQGQETGEEGQNREDPHEAGE